MHTHKATTEIEYGKGVTIEATVTVNEADGSFYDEQIRVNGDAREVLMDMVTGGWKAYDELMDRIDEAIKNPACE